MAVLQSTNVQGTLCVNGVAVGGGKDFKFCCFTGSDNWTPSQDLVDGGGSVEVILVAGGGGGGASARCSTNNGCNCPSCQYCHFAGGGGGGEVSHFYKTITSTDACCHIIGAGGQTGSGCIQDQTACITAPSEKGGNSSFLGVTSYGGGGGVSSVGFCTLLGQPKCAVDATNKQGGPVGGDAQCTNTTSEGIYTCTHRGYTTATLGGSTATMFGPMGSPLNQTQGNNCATTFDSIVACEISSSYAVLPQRDYCGDALADGVLNFPQSSGSPNSSATHGFGRGGGTSIGCRQVYPFTYGDGGVGQVATCPNSQDAACCRPIAGNPGIVVLKWAE